MTGTNGAGIEDSGAPLPLRATVQDLLPPGAVGVELTSPCPVLALGEREQEAVAKATPKRAMEFAAGRYCARTALQMLGVETTDLPAAASGAPVWPNGIIGSISHCADFCAAVVMRRGAYGTIGIDTEVRRRVPPNVWREIVTDEELASALATSLGDAADVVTLAFSAKEAFYKAHAPLYGMMLDFLDVHFRIVDHERFEITPLQSLGAAPSANAPRAGSFHIDHAHVFTIIAW